MHLMSLLFSIIYSSLYVQVSPTYSQEVSGNTAVAPHLHKFHGILNGIDPDIWDPYNDDFLPVSSLWRIHNFPFLFFLFSLIMSRNDGWNYSLYCTHLLFYVKNMNYSLQCTTWVSYKLIQGNGKWIVVLENPHWTLKLV